MSTSRGFPARVIEALEKSMILGVRSGDEHRFTGVWVVVWKGRVFARSWNDKPTGWHRAFMQQKLGAIQVPNGRSIRVVAKRSRGERLLAAIDRAYAEKYKTPASKKWVRGFKLARRRSTTTEFVPA
jgi:hypothetical protein